MRKNIAVALLMVVFMAGGAHGQGADAALRDRVGQLVERLDDDDEARRDEAAKALLDLGPRVLPFLPEPGAIADQGRAERLEEVRAALAMAAQRVNLGPSTVTIRGEGIRLSEAIRMLQQQSGNRITDLREPFGQEATNPALDLDIDGRPFFEALDTICAKAALVPNFYTGDGTIGLMVADDPALQPQGVEGDAVPRPEPMIRYSGPFRVQFLQIAARRDFTTGVAEASARFEVAWEPRLRPMLLALAAEDVRILDDRGATVRPSVMEESGSIVLRPENPVAEVNLNMDAPDRAAQALETLSVKAEVTLPGGFRTFRFDDLSQPGTQTVDDLSMQLVSTQVEDFVWKVRVLLQYPGAGPAFESYQQGLFNNTIYLQKADGTRFEHNGGFSNLGSGGGRIGFEYLFVDVPGMPSDWSLVYETPSSVETIPLEFSFEDVPLP